MIDSKLVFCFISNKMVLCNKLGSHFIVRKQSVSPETPPVRNHCIKDINPERL